MPATDTTTQAVAVYTMAEEVDTMTEEEAMDTAVEAQAITLGSLEAQAITLGSLEALGITPDTRALLTSPSRRPGPTPAAGGRTPESGLRGA